MDGKAYTGSDVYGGLSYSATGDSYQKAMATLLLHWSRNFFGTVSNVAYDAFKVTPDTIFAIFPCTVNGYFACSDDTQSSQ
jgi:hypothetical protein